MTNTYRVQRKELHDKLINDYGVTGLNGENGATNIALLPMFKDYMEKRIYLEEVEKQIHLIETMGAPMKDVLNHLATLERNAWEDVKQVQQKIEQTPLVDPYPLLLKPIKNNRNDELLFENGFKLITSITDTWGSDVSADFSALYDTTFMDTIHTGFAIELIENGMRLNGYFVPVYNHTSGDYSHDAQLAVTLVDNNRKQIQRIVNFDDMTLNEYIEWEPEF